MASFLPPPVVLLGPRLLINASRHQMVLQAYVSACAGPVFPEISEEAPRLITFSVINLRHSSWGLSLQVLLDGNGR